MSTKNKYKLSKTINLILKSLQFNMCPLIAYRARRFTLKCVQIGPPSLQYSKSCLRSKLKLMRHYINAVNVLVSTGTLILLSSCISLRAGTVSYDRAQYYGLSDRDQYHFLLRFIKKILLFNKTFVSTEKLFNFVLIRY